MSNTNGIINPEKPDHVITLDISAVKTLQIGYQAETIFLSHSDDQNLIINEYIGYNAYEYFGKVNANRFKTTIRYGRRESVNTKAFVEIFLPKTWHGEFLLYTQYGHISCTDTIEVERFAAETSEGAITLTEIIAPRIRLASSSNSILLENATGFADIHTTSGNIVCHNLHGGLKFETTTGGIDATISSLNNVAEFSSLSGNMQITLPTDGGIVMDGITKRGKISSMVEGLEIRQKPGNVLNIVGSIGEKPFQNVKFSTINGSIIVQ